MKGSVNMSFIVKKEESSSKTIRMPNALIEKLEDIASKKNISFNKLIIQCCQYAVDNLEENNK
jgi:predicted HicB family RNase H-like nuclease